MTDLLVMILLVGAVYLAAQRAYARQRKAIATLAGPASSSSP